MKLFEYQAKDVFKEFSIPVPRGGVIEDISALEEAWRQMEMGCVLKAQVLRGSRGKAGLIQFAGSLKEAKTKAEKLFAADGVKRILVEEAIEIETEFYLSIAIDPVRAKAVIMASVEGGVDIEEIAQKDASKIVKQQVDIDSRIMPYQTRNILFGLGLSGEIFKETAGIISHLFELFQKRDAELAEINPLVITKGGRLIAVDAKLILDDGAAYRQKAYQQTREHFDSDIEYEASQKGIPYLQFEGDIGLMCAGAGLTNAVYDLINDYGGSVANYLEFGGPNYKRAVEAMELTLKGCPKVILIVTFGTIARADVMAQGIAEAISRLKPTIPIVTAIRGTGEEDAQKILKDIGLEPLLDTEEAVQRAVQLCGKGKK